QTVISGKLLDASDGKPAVNVIVKALTADTENDFLKFFQHFCRDYSKKHYLCGLFINKTNK
ncbi:MAG: hypothetical protein LBD53_00965, partial [Tannerella sp.]|nr:hypothetical protein [Tannerella sp.]